MPSRDQTLSAAAVYLVRKGQNLILPPTDTELKPGDRVLFIGRERARIRQLRFLNEPGVFDYVRTGVQTPRGWLFRKLQAIRAARLHAAGQ